MLERLNQAMDHVEEHLGDPVDVAELARIAATSEYHFRRMFTALAGIPLSEYVRRRRLTLAGAEVLAGERTLLDVAVRYGYGSGEAFARAFRAVHGVGPGEARRTGAVLSAQPRMSFRLTVEGRNSMRYRVVEKDGFTLLGRGTRVPLVYEGMNPAIVAFVRSIGKETLGRWEAYGHGEPAGVLAVVSDHCADDAEGTEIGYFQGVVSDAEEVPGAPERLDVGPGVWAVFESSGDFPSAVQYLWRDVYTQWFPSNPYRSRPGPSLSRTRVSEDGTHADAEVWIPVERADG